MNHKHCACWHITEAEYADIKSHVVLSEVCCDCGKERTRTVWLRTKPVEREHGRYAPKEAA